VAAGRQVPLFTTAVVNGQRTVTGLQPVFTSRLNPGNSLLVLIDVRPCDAVLSCPVVSGLILLPISTSVRLCAHVGIVPRQSENP
jgi:hypothetical protein